MATAAQQHAAEYATWEASDYVWDPRKLVAAPAGLAPPPTAQPLSQPPRPTASGSASETTDNHSQLPSPSRASTPKSSAVPVLMRMRTNSYQNACRVEGCNKNLADEKAYYKRYSICQEHLRCLALSVDGKLSRFCFQCGKLEPLENFEGDKRSCRAQLQEHNKRRRKGALLRRQPRRARTSSSTSPKKAAPKRRARAKAQSDDADDDVDTGAGEDDVLQAFAGLQHGSFGMKQEQARLARGSAFASHQAGLSRVRTTSLERTVSQFDEALAMFAMQAGCDAAGDVSPALPHTASAHVPHTFSASPLQPVVSLPASGRPPLGHSGAGAHATALARSSGAPQVSHQLNKRSGSMELLIEAALSLEGERMLASPVGQPVGSQQPMALDRPAAAENGSAAASGHGGDWGAGAADTCQQRDAAAPPAHQRRRQRPHRPSPLSLPPLQPFHSEPVPQRLQSQQLRSQGSGSQLSSPFTTMASAPLPPAPGALGSGSSTANVGRQPSASMPMGGLGSWGLSCSLQRALSGGSLPHALSKGDTLQRVLSDSLFSLSSMQLDAALGRGDSLQLFGRGDSMLLPPVAPLSTTKPEDLVPLSLPLAEQPAVAAALGAPVQANLGAAVASAALAQLAAPMQVNTAVQPALQPQLPAVKGEGPGTHYTPSELNIRLAMKLPNCTPDQLPPDMHAALTQALALGDMTIMQGFLRPGCVQLVLDVRRKMPAQQGMKPEELQQLLVDAEAGAADAIGWDPLAQLAHRCTASSSSSSSSSSSPSVLQLGSAGALVSDGCLQRQWQGTAAHDAAQLMWAGPCCIVSEPGCEVVVAGKGLCSGDVKVFARSQGTFLAMTASPATRTGATGPQLPNSCLTLQLDAAPASGLAFLECERRKVLSRPVPVLLVDDIHMAREVSDALEPVLRCGTAIERAAAEQLLIDMGLLLEFEAAWKMAGGAAAAVSAVVKPVQQASAGACAGLSCGQAGAFVPVGLGLARALRQQRAHQDSPGASAAAAAAQQRADLAALAQRVLAHCQERGWKHSSRRLAPVLVILAAAPQGAALQEQLNQAAAEPVAGAIEQVAEAGPAQGGCMPVDAAVQPMAAAPAAAASSKEQQWQLAQAACGGSTMLASEAGLPGSRRCCSSAAVQEAPLDVCLLLMALLLLDNMAWHVQQAGALVAWGVLSHKLPGYGGPSCSAPHPVPDSLWRLQRALP